MVAADNGALAASAVLARKVLAERVRNLFGVSLYGHAASLAGVAVATYGLYGVVDHRFLLAWTVLQVLTATALILLYIRYRSAPPAGLDPAGWERYFAVGAGAAGCGWGLYAYVLMPSYSTTHQMLVVCVVLAMILIGLASMQSSRQAFEWFAFPALAGLVLELVTRGGSLYHATAALVMALSALMLYLFLRINREMEQMLTARFQNDSLVQDLIMAERTASKVLSEQQLIFDTAMVGIMYVESMQDRRISRCNRRLEEILGYAPGELAGRPLRALYASTGIWEESSARIEVNLGAKGIHEEEAARMRKDGSQVWCRIAGRLVDPLDSSKGVIWVFEDLTARRAAEEERLRSEFRFDLAINASPAGMWDWDLRVDRLYYSPRFRELLGYADEAEFDRAFSFREHLHPEDRDRVLGIVREHLAGKGVVDEMFRLRCRNGLYRWFLARGQAQWDEAGKAVGFSGAITDVTQVKVHEEALRRAEAALREALVEEQAILDTAMVGIVIVKDRVIQRCNRWCEEILGYMEAELTGVSSRVLYPTEEDFAGLGVRASRAITEFGRYHEERILVRKDRSEVWCYLAGQPLDRANPDRGVLWVMQDITEHKRAEAQLRKSEERLALAVRASDSGIWDWDLASDEMFYSARFRELVGYPNLSNDRFRTAFSFRDNLHPEDRERTLAAVQRALHTLEPFNEICRLRGADGSYRWFHSRGQAQGGGQGSATRLAGSITDVTEARSRDQMLARARADLAAAHDRLSDAIECIPDAFALFDAKDHLVLCNRNYARVFAGEEQGGAVVGRTFEELVRSLVARGEEVPGEYKGDAEAWIAERVRKHRNPVGVDTLYQLGDKRWYQVRERRTRDGGIVGVRTDVTELKAGEERIQHLANHDPLTGLPNRRLLEDRMEQAFILSRRNRTQVGVLVLDLDKFKVINDREGHRVGDDVLREVASRLRSCVREADTVARHGGDEFVVLLPELHDEQDAVRVAEKIVARVASPIQIEERHYSVGASIGIAVYPGDALDADNLLRCGDQAMYSAKQGGGNGVRRHAP